MPAAVSSAIPVVAGSASTSGRGCANARTSLTQPGGVAHRSHVSPETVSATTRATNASARAAVALSTARRRVPATWLVTAPTPANTGIGEIAASARNPDGAAGSPPATKPASRPSHRSAAPVPIAASDAANAARLLTPLARTSSWRPASSSARSVRTAASTPQTAGERDFHGPRAQVPQVGERALVDEPSVTQDPDAVADRLDLAEDVRREEDRLPPVPRLSHGRAERHLHQRVQPPVGSSRISRSARVAKAAISCTFCRLPFDSARTRLPVSSAKRSTSTSR
jgi:hypothetical protein